MSDNKLFYLRAVGVVSNVVVMASFFAFIFTISKFYGILILSAYATSEILSYFFRKEMRKQGSKDLEEGLVKLFAQTHGLPNRDEDGELYDKPRGGNC